MMKTIGINASNNIYLSWDDAIVRAIDRYGIVMDNYKRGMYRKHNRPFEGFLAFYAKMLGIIGA